MALDTITCTTTERDDLAAAIKSGQTRVRTSSGRLVEYASLEEMLSVLEKMERYLGNVPSSAATSASRHSRAAFSRS